MEQFDPPEQAFIGASVVLFNGPPRCGKDTAGHYLTYVAKVPRSRVMKFAGMLKRSTHMDYGLPPEIADNAFERCKDEPHPAFFGKTPREAYIEKSEKRQKPFLGNDIYGRVLLRRMWRAYQEGIRVFWITDSGFAEEATPLISAIGVEKFMLVRIHADLRGCNFNNDSRTYIELPGVRTVDLHNDGTHEAFYTSVLEAVLPFVM